MTTFRLHHQTLTNQTIINSMVLHRFIMRLWLTSISSIRLALYHHNIALSRYVLVHMLVKFWHNWLKIFPSKSSCKIPPETNKDTHIHCQFKKFCKIDIICFNQIRYLMNLLFKVPQK